MNMSPEKLAETIADTHVHVAQAKSDMDDILASKLFLVGVMKRAFPETPQEERAADAIAELIEMTNAVICEDGTPTGLKLRALLERIVKRAAPRFGFEKTIRRTTLLEAVDYAMKPHEFDEEMPTVDTSVIQTKISYAPEVFADTAIRWFAICHRIRAAVHEEHIHPFIRMFYEMVLNVLEELARQKRYGMLDHEEQREKEVVKVAEEEVVVKEEPLGEDDDDVIEVE